MRSRRRFALWSVVLAGWAWALGATEALAQTANRSRSLGGYGATSGGSLGGLGSSPMIPYAGSFGGFMPYRMSGGASSGLSFSSRGSSVMESSRPSFSLTPMSGAMGTGIAPRTGLLAPFRSQDGMGLGGARMLNQPMGGADNSRVMPPNFGYPFYQPPSLLSPGGSVAGMSM